MMIVWGQIRLEDPPRSEGIWSAREPESRQLPSHVPADHVPIQARDKLHMPPAMTLIMNMNMNVKATME